MVFVHVGHCSRSGRLRDGRRQACRFCEQVFLFNLYSVKYAKSLGLEMRASEFSGAQESHVDALSGVDD